ncbi:MAG: GAF domain-containing sensor histidine kinase [Elainellaceae cyanobacterium]
MIDHIRDSLELNVVLQTAVDETAALMRVEHCLFCWYFKDAQRIEVVCECISNRHASFVGHYSPTEFGISPALLEAGNILMSVSHWPRSWSRSWPRLRGGKLFGKLLSSTTSITSIPLLKILDAQTSLVIPIEEPGEAIGFVVCLSEQVRQWPDSKLELMQAIAQQVEIAIRQARLYETTQKQARREHLINQITTQTRQSLDLPTILTQAIAHLQTALESDRCLVRLVNSDKNVEFVPSLNQTDDISSTQAWTHFETVRAPFLPTPDPSDPHESMTQWMIDHRQTVVISDVATDSRAEPDQQNYRAAQIKSLLVVPVQTDQTLLAILYLNQCSHRRYWSKDDQALAHAVANQLAISIQQGHLYAQMQRQAVRSAAQAEHLARTLDELKQTQVQLIQSEKLYSLGQLVAGLAHEINNPVSFIHGNIPYIDRYVQELLTLINAYQAQIKEPSEQIRQLSNDIDLEFIVQDLPHILDSMRSGTQRIQQVVSSLRNFSGLDTAQVRSIDLQDALDNTLFVLQSYTKPDIKVIRQYHPLPAVECFPRLLNQVFLNLMTNAIEAMQDDAYLYPAAIAGNSPDSPAKLMTLMTTPVVDEAGIPSVKIAIADTGYGIPERIKDRIFDPFFTTKPMGRGVGLGLSVCYQIVVNQHRGQLTVESEPGQGTTVEIRLPIHQVDPSTQNYCRIPTEHLDARQLNRASSR